MKTEQELKDELEDIFFDALTDKSNPPYYTDKVDPENDGRWQYKVYELCADELIKRGYGDVSEHKAEIERLRTTLGQCNTELNSALESLKSQCREIGELRAKVKQAQIDVLNELRERITKDRVANDTVVINANYEIKELIKEIKNDKCNC